MTIASSDQTQTGRWRTLATEAQMLERLPLDTNLAKLRLTFTLPGCSRARATIDAKVQRAIKPLGRLERRRGRHDARALRIAPLLGRRTRPLAACHDENMTGFRTAPLNFKRNGKSNP